MAADLQNDSPAGSWLPYEPNDAAPWNRQRVVHLHRRAGFAANWAELERDLADGPRKAVDRLLARSRVSPKLEDGSIRETNPPPAPPYEGGEFESMARTIGDAAQASNNPNRLKAWWLYRMLLSPDPLGERLTLMWHKHFATSNRKVQDLVLMREQNELLREHGRGKFGKLLHAVVKHPAKLIWLDTEANRKGRPNENLAREMLELFTLGIGHYMEDDVQAAARALTGWAVVRGHFGFREARHNAGTVTLLGKSGSLTVNPLSVSRRLVCQSGNFSGIASLAGPHSRRYPAFLDALPRPNRAGAVQMRAGGPENRSLCCGLCGIYGPNCQSVCELY